MPQSRRATRELALLFRQMGASRGYRPQRQYILDMSLYTKREIKTTVVSGSVQAVLVSVPVRHVVRQSNTQLAHQLKAIAGGPSKTTLDGIALICANCHAMIHTKNPPIAIEELRKLVTHH